VSSAWRIEYEAHAQRQLRKIDRAVAVRIVKTLQRDLDRHGDPRAFGEAMIGIGRVSGAPASATIERLPGSRMR
jgi:hypothetical protein